MNRSYIKEEGRWKTKSVVPHIFFLEVKLIYEVFTPISNAHTLTASSSPQLLLIHHSLFCDTENICYAKMWNRALKQTVLIKKSPRFVIHINDSVYSTALQVVALRL